jgi:hypothetical protein
VAIVGGGNVAIDVARSCRQRWGPKTSASSTAEPGRKCRPGKRKFQAAEAEGVNITYLAAPQEALTDQRAGDRVLRCIRMELGEPDSSGQAAARAGSRQRVRSGDRPADSGHRPAAGSFGASEAVEDLAFTRWGTTEVDPVTYATGPQRRFCRRRSPDRSLGGHRRHCGRQGSGRVHRSATWTAGIWPRVASPRPIERTRSTGPCGLDHSGLPGFEPFEWGRSVRFYPLRSVPTTTPTIPT